jgi:DNA ligase (NAD+)
MGSRMKIEELREVIRYHNKLYYEDSTPEISDYDYDMLVKELELSESPDAPASSPINTIGSSSNGNIVHSTVMYSLDNVYSIDELIEFDNKIKKLLGVDKVEYCAELKLDGVSISLMYVNGKLTTGATRGNGKVGENITSNVKLISSIPNELLIDATVDVRGEVYMKRSVLANINSIRSINDVKLLSNTRNATSGIIRREDSSDSDVPPSILTSSFYNIPSHIVSQSNALAILTDLGLPIDSNYITTSSIEEIIDYFNRWQLDRDALDYDIDGIVIKVNSNVLQEELGYTSRAPKWAVAYKFPSGKASTKLEGIILQVGKTGSVTPVAALTPVSIGGTVISRATLHNMDEITRKDIRIGDTVIVERAGDVIPAVSSVVTDDRNGSEIVFEMPDNCPVCDTALIRVEDEAAYRCPNYYCSAQVKGRIEAFASKQCMDIEGLGPSVVSLLVDNNILQDVSSLYYLDELRDEITKLEGMGARSVTLLLNSIEASKDRDIARLIHGLTIRYVSRGTCDRLTRYYDSIVQLMNASIDDLTKIEDIGPITANSIYEFFNDDNNIRLINRLSMKGVRMNNIPKPTGGALEGKTLVVTGTLSKPREEVHDIIRTAGGKVGSSVGKKTDYLVVGADAGSKAQKAISLGVKTITEEELMEIISV